VLEQFQAQISSALRRAFAGGCPPALIDAGCELTASAVQEALLHDPPVLKRMVKSLLPADFTSTLVAVPSSETWSFLATQTHLSRLAALARLQMHAVSCSNTKTTDQKAVQAQKVLNEAFKQHIGALKEHWVAVVRDHLILMQDTGSWPVIGDQHSKRKRLCGMLFAEGDDIPSVRQRYDDCWPVIATAAASVVNTNEHFELDRAAAVAQCHLLLSTAVCSVAQAAVCEQDSAGPIVQCLQTMRWLLAPPFLMNEEFTSSAFNELLKVVAAIVQTHNDREVQEGAVLLLHQLVVGTGADYLKTCLAHEGTEGTSSSDPPLLRALIEACVWPIHRQVPHALQEPAVGPTVDATQAASASSELIILAHSLITLSCLPAILPPSSASVYLPPLLELSLQLSQYSAREEHQMISASLRNTKAVLAAVGCMTGEDEQQQLLFAGAVASLNDSTETLFKTARAGAEDTIRATITLWTTVLTLVPPPIISGGTDLQIRILRVWQCGMLAPDLSVQAVVLASLREFLQAGVAAGGARAVTSHTFLGALGPQVLVALKLEEKIRSEGGSGPVQDTLCTEGTKLLLLAFTVAPPAHHTALMAVMLPLLLRLLAAGKTLEQLACQCILHIAQRAALAFKQTVSALPPAQRQLLETTLRASLTAGAKPTSVAKPAMPMKLDMSRFK
jgi:hypothetical protein